MLEEGLAGFPVTIEALAWRSTSGRCSTTNTWAWAEKNNSCRTSECTHLQEVFLSINSTSRAHVSIVQCSHLLKYLFLFYIDLLILLVEVTGVSFLVTYAYLTPQTELLGPWHSSSVDPSIIDKPLFTESQWRSTLHNLYSWIKTRLWITPQ
jgi:hypothetical protein